MDERIKKGYKNEDSYCFLNGVTERKSRVRRSLKFLYIRKNKRIPKFKDLKKEVLTYLSR